MWGCGSSKVALLALLAGCGDPIAGVGYRGEPLLTLQGEVLNAEPLGALDGQPSVAVFWSAGPDREGSVEQAVEVETQFPAFYKLYLYLPPPDEVMHEGGRGDGMVGTVGVVLLYVDEDTDGALSPEDEPVIGAGEGSIVTWFETAPEDLPDGEVQTYHLQSTDDEGCPQFGPEEGERVERTDLVVGEVCELLPDWDCDGARAEWGTLCAEG